MFCKPLMFQVLLSTPRLSFKTKSLVHALMDLTINFDEQTHTDDIKYKRYLNDVIEDKQKVSEELRNLIHIVRDKEQLISMGRHLFNKVSMWRKPSEENIKTLRAILLLEKNIYADKPEDTNHLLI